MRKGNAELSQRSINISLGVTGASIGWLMGLSVSPVVSIVITSVVGLAAALAAALSGLESKSDSSDRKIWVPASSGVWRVNPMPLAILATSILLGSFVGVLMRTYGWLEPGLAAEISNWTAPGVNLGEREVAQHLLQSKYPLGEQSESDASAADKARAGVLFTLGIEDCRALWPNQGEELRSELEDLAKQDVQPIGNLLTIITDTVTLEKLVKDVLCVGASP